MMTVEKKPLYLLGASGHAKVIIDSIEQAGQYHIQGLFDKNKALWGQTLSGYPILGDFEVLPDSETELLIAIGDNTIRYKLYKKLVEQGIVFGTVTHPSSTISRGVAIRPGTVMMAGTVVNADTIIGAQVIINTCASVDHDCQISTAVHIAPGVRICGGVSIGERTFVGAGAVVIPNIRIGADVIVGAGATVVRDIPDAVVIMGTPARIIKQRN
jgi:sugar O-acyltransferase (sialic acid O-acetyltransferase NeuD family)